MSIQPEILWTDALIYLLIICLGVVVWRVRRNYHTRRLWLQVFSKPMAAIAGVLLIFYVGMAALDSLHFRIANNPNSFKIYSLLDVMISPIGKHTEKTYSAPMAMHLYNKESRVDGHGVSQQFYPKLKLTQNLKQSRGELVLYAMIKSALYSLFIIMIFIMRLWLKPHPSDKILPVKSILVTTFTVLWLIFSAVQLAQNFYVFGTDKIGQDVLYQALKSIRTGLIIGTLTTFVMLPFALVLGTAAGYFKGWVDDIIQYCYTTISSIPGVLLIAASVLAMQVTIDNNPQLFSNNMQRADMQLLILCLILGVASWTSLCRLLRAETFKLSSMDYVKASKALGASNKRIIFRHITPNLMHIILITITLDFSGLVLAEAVLSYVGVGVHPLTFSWGNMINMARLELAREPVVWWPLLSAFVLMFFLVLSANVFADAVRDAFDPRSEK